MTSRLDAPLQMRTQDSHSAARLADARGEHRVPFGLRRGGVDPVGTVECHRQHARQCRLAGAPRPAEEIPMRHASTRDRAPKGVRDVILYGDISERARPVLASKSERHVGQFAQGAATASGSATTRTSRAGRTHRQMDATAPARYSRSDGATFTPRTAATFGVLTELAGSRPPRPGARGSYSAMRRGGSGVALSPRARATCRCSASRKYPPSLAMPHPGHPAAPAPRYARRHR